MIANVTNINHNSRPSSDRCSPREAERMKAVSLFTGAGGLDLGLVASGWRILAQVEMDPDCVATLRGRAENEKHTPSVINKPIEAVDVAALRRDLKLKRGELGLLAGGPPCQPFTTSGLRQAINDRRASSLFPAYFRFVDEFSPRLLLIENVDGMLSAALRHRPLKKRGPGNPPLAPEEQKGSFLRWFLEQLTCRGYSVSWGVVEAADYGVPQMRQRSIVIGVKGSEPCYLPPPRFGRQDLPSYRCLRYALAEIEELGPIQPLSKRKREVYARIPAGGNWRNLSKTLRKETMGAAFLAEGGKSGWWRRLSWDSPAPTILGMPDHSSTALIHPEEIRCLSVNECAAIQTFPMGTIFRGAPRSQYQQIGNAVPVLLAEILGEHLRSYAEGFRLPPPPPPEWRKASANRRIGTHGWAVPMGKDCKYHINARIRDDHVWALEKDLAPRPKKPRKQRLIRLKS